MKNINYFIERAENDLKNGFNFDEYNFDCIIYELEEKSEEYENICWRELVDRLKLNGWKYCRLEDSIITDEYAKEIGLIDNDD